MPNKKNIILITIAIIFCITILTFLFIKKRSNKIKSIKNQIQIKSDLKIKNFQLQQAMQNKSNKWVLKAKKGKIYRNDNKAKCTNTKATFLHNEKKVAYFSAPKCNFDLQDNKVEMEGKITSQILNNPT